MIFPEYTRVIYDKNPLELVVCQFRFPPILRIDAETPAPFQDRIRKEYPLFEPQQVLEQNIPISPELTKLIGMQMMQMQFGVGRSGYKFSTSDRNWDVVLTRDFLAISTKKYRCWEDFKQHLEGPFTAFKELYSPDSFTRIGLRYRDVIKKSELGLKDEEWAALLQSNIVGELSSSIASSIQQVGRELLVVLDGGVGQVRIRHGMPQVKDSIEPQYFIDADFFSDERMEVADAMGRLDRFNGESGRLFRWCITDRLHNAMGPQPFKR